MKPLFLFGTAGHARDVADVAEALGWRPVFVARDAGELDDWKHDDDIVLEAEATRFDKDAFAIGIGDNAARARVASRYVDRLRFPSLIHPETSFGKGTRAAIEATNGTIVFAGCRFTNSIAVGDFCTFNLNATISHDVEIGDFVNLSPGANVTGNVVLGEQAWLGIGVAVNQGTGARKLHIGARCVIGSGAVVLGDCEADSVYVGVPARRIR